MRITPVCLWQLTFRRVGNCGGYVPCGAIHHGDVSRAVIGEGDGGVRPAYAHSGVASIWSILEVDQRFTDAAESPRGLCGGHVGANWSWALGCSIYSAVEHVVCGVRDWRYDGGRRCGDVCGRPAVNDEARQKSLMGEIEWNIG